MVIYCWVPGCKVQSGKRVKMHRFPKSYQTHKLWVNAIQNPLLCGKDQIGIQKTYRVYHTHFGYDQKIEHGSRGSYLKLNAVPMLILYSTILGNMLSFSTGASINWSATIPPRLESNDTSINPLPEPSTGLESAWVVTIVSLGCIIGPLTGKAIMENIGKKKTILILGIPVALCHLIIAFANRVWMFLIARFIMGISLGSAIGVMASYVGDVAEDKNRGLLVSMTMIFISLGGLSVYVTGPFISIRLFSLLQVIPLILLFTLFGLFVPELPYDLLQKNAMEEAKKSLALYRGIDLADVDMEFNKLVEHVNGSDSRKGKKKVGAIEELKIIFNSSSLLQGFKLLGIILLIQVFTGMGAVAAYYQKIFEESGGSLKSTYSVIMIGIVTLCSTLLTSQLVERIGRKVILLIGFSFMGLSLFSLGTYFLLKVKNFDTEPISWLPLASLIVFTVAFNVQGNIPWVLLTDIFPPNVLDICTSLASMTIFLLNFIITFAFPYLEEALGHDGTFYMFGCCMVCAVLFTIFFIPETKGRSAKEVQELLRKK